MEILKAERERDWYCGESRYKYIVKTEVGTFAIHRHSDGHYPWTVHPHNCGTGEGVGGWLKETYRNHRRFYTKRGAIEKISEEVEYRRNNKENIR